LFLFEPAIEEEGREVHGERITREGWRDG
jgi:hypothetical protein